MSGNSAPRLERQRACPAGGCGAMVTFGDRKNPGAPVAAVCPACGSHLSLRAGILRIADGSEPETTGRSAPSCRHAA